MKSVRKFKEFSQELLGWIFVAGPPILSFQLFPLCLVLEITLPANQKDTMDALTGRSVRKRSIASSTFLTQIKNTIKIVPPKNRKPAAAYVTLTRTKLLRRSFSASICLNSSSDIFNYTDMKNLHYSLLSKKP